MTFLFEKLKTITQSLDEILYKEKIVILKAEELNSYENEIPSANAINDLRIVK